jgi:hypothetical protein
VKLLVNCLSVATTIMDENKKRSDAEIAGLDSALGASITEATAAHVARVSRSEEQLEGAKLAASATHASGLKARQRAFTKLQKAFVAIETAYDETRESCLAAAANSSSGTKRKAAIETLAPSGKRGRVTTGDAALSPRQRPAAHTCPLTLETMVDPVIAADGHTYERAAIEKWFENHATSPITNAELPHTGLIANVMARQWIAEWEL